MTFQPERASINQRVQLGAESTSAIGTAVAASKLMECFDWVFGIDGDIQTYRATGHKYPTVQEENTEWVAGTVGGTFDYNGVIYPLSSVMGSVSASTHGSSATAKDWVFQPPTSGSVAPQTFTIQQGDSTHAHSFAYGLFTTFGYKGDRKSFTVSGNTIGQPLSDGITLTSNPTPIALAPIVAKQVSIYLDSSSGALGSTQLLRALSVDFNMGGVYQAFWTLNRGTVGFTSHVDLAPSTMIKIMVEADTQGMSLLTDLQTGSTVYIRVSAQGAQIAADGPGAVYQSFTHDMAVKIGKPSTFQDKDGLFAIEWPGLVVEDPTWGKSQTATVTNLLTAL